MITMIMLRSSATTHETIGAATPNLRDTCAQSVSKNFQSRTARLQHYRTSSKHRVCSHCTDDVDFLNIAHLRTHWRQTHRDIYCHLCDKHFRIKWKLQAHVEKEHYPYKLANRFTKPKAFFTSIGRRQNSTRMPSVVDVDSCSRMSTSYIRTHLTS